VPESRQPLHVFGSLGQVAAAQGDGGEDRDRERVAGEAPVSLHPPRGRFGERDRIVEPADLDEGGGQEHVRAEMRGLVRPDRRPRRPHGYLTG
jgi:hypothetical protein